MLNITAYAVLVSRGFEEFSHGRREGARNGIGKPLIELATLD
jgi:hypothetical protein